MEVHTKHKNIESIDSPGAVDKFTGKSCAKDMRGWISGRIGIATKSNNLEVRQLFRTIEKAYNYYHPRDEEKEVIRVTIEGWKAMGSTEIYKGFVSGFILIEHIKNKETKIVDNVSHDVSKVAVNRLLFILKKWKINEIHSCYEVADMLGYDWKEIWGNRTEVYFPFYYYPIKVLEAIGVIKYGGRGSITRIL